MDQDAARPVRRILRQHLESLKRAGLTHLARSPANLEPAGVDVGSRNARLPAHQSSVRSSAKSRATPAAVVTAGSLFPELNPPSQEKTAAVEMERSSLSLARREERLQVLADCVADCVRCPELAQTRTQTVFGVGSPQAKLMLIGEAPGADEDRQGEPFVGRAGQLLNRIIAACKLTREEIYICNVLKCRPPGNRNPAPAEARNCREYLDGQIAAVDPDYIICLGSVAAQNLLDTTASVGRLRGKFFRYGRAKVACTYHPSYLLRNPAAKKDVWADMRFVMRDLGVELQ